LKDAPVGEFKKLADEITERFQQVQHSEKKKQYIGISDIILLSQLTIINIVVISEINIVSNVLNRIRETCCKRFNNDKI